MVRLYCLTRIYKIEANKYYYGEKVIPYSDGADENLFSGIEEEITPHNILELNFSRFYELTEICIGYKLINNRKVFVMHLFRDDTRLCVIRMIRGAVRFRQATRNALDLTISTSTLFPGKLKHDLFMRIRWVKTTPTGTNIIDKEEERLYREFAEARKNEQITNSSGDDNESVFDKIKFEIPNSSKSNVLRTKMSRFLMLLKYLCDPNTGSYKNVPNDYEYNQLVKCFLAERSWKSQKPRKDELQKQAENFRECREIHWRNLSMENQKLENFDPKYVMSANFHNVNIFDAKQKMYQSFKNLFPESLSEAQKHGRPNQVLRESNFRILKHLTLISCYIEELTDEFFDILPKKLLSLCFNGNKITKISKKISEFIKLKDLELNDNKELGDDGIPWESLPPTLEHLKLKRTNISIIPTEIQRLQKLETLEISSENLKDVEWFEISDTIVRLIVEGGKQLNEIELTSKINLRTFHILQTGLTEIDCSKLPTNIADFKMSNNKVTEFDAKNNLENVQSLSLINNGLQTIKWENLPVLLEVLYVERNRLTEIDDGISQMSNLSDILAGYNNITKLSDRFWKLQKLTSINLEHNELSSLPRCFELLLNLKKLDLSHNKFDYEHKSLLEGLWQRLPTNLKVLRLGGNNLHSLPCWLKRYNLTDLQVDDCKLSHICPNLFSKRQEQNQNLNIERNKGIQFLPFLPSQIYHSNSDDETSPSSNLTIYIDNEMLIGKPISAMEPLYRFKKNADLNIGCKCCANCGNETEEAVIEQLMIMDFHLKISKDVLVSTDIEISKDQEAGEEKIYRSDTVIAALPPPATDLPFKSSSYSAGKWQTVVQTCLCPECLKMIKVKIVASQKSNIKKIRINGNEEINIPLSSHLLLSNLTSNDSFLNAAVNLLDAMKSLRNMIFEKNSRNVIENELANILQRKVYSVENLRKLIPPYTFNKNSKAASALKNIFEIMNDEMKELFQFSYEKHEFCMCETRKSEGIIHCLTLPISVGSMLTTSESFETMLNRWYKFEPEFCFLCRRNTWQKPNLEIGEKQKFLIVEMDSWIKLKNNKRDIEQCRISSETFNINSQEIFGQNWKLIAAIYGDSFHRYSTWRRFYNSWIVINDEQFKIKDKLLEDFKDYKIFLFEKLEENEESNSGVLHSDLDQKLITVCKNVTYSTCLQLPQPEILHNSVTHNSMEVDDFWDVNSIQPYNPAYDNRILPVNQYHEFTENINDEFNQPHTTMTNNTFYPNYSINYSQQQTFQPQQIYPNPFEPNNFNNQSFVTQDYGNYDNPQSYINTTYSQPPQNTYYPQYGSSELQPINPSNYYNQNMNANTTEENQRMLNPQNGPL